MPTWVFRVLIRVRGLAASGRLRFTDKASAEMWALGLSRDDVLRHEGVLVSCHEDQAEADDGADGTA